MDGFAANGCEVSVSFKPTDLAALKTAVDACCSEGTGDGSCPVFGASNDAVTGQPYGAIGEWDTSEVTDMHNLFYLKKTFTADLTNWDTSRVTNMVESTCSSLRSGFSLLKN